MSSQVIGFYVLKENQDDKKLIVGESAHARVSVQGVKSLGGHFACLYRGFEFYEVKKKIIIFIVKSLQKEQNSTNLLL